jgi:hypothetical protein
MSHQIPSCSQSRQQWNFCPWLDILLLPTNMMVMLVFRSGKNGATSMVPFKPGEVVTIDESQLCKRFQYEEGSVCLEDVTNPMQNFFILPIGPRSTKMFILNPLDSSCYEVQGKPWRKSSYMSGSRGTSNRSCLQSHATSLDVSFANNMHCSCFARTSRGAASSDPASSVMRNCVLSSTAKKDPNTTPNIVLLDDEIHSPPHPISLLKSTTTTMTTPPSTNLINLLIEGCVHVPVKTLSSHHLPLKRNSYTRTAFVEQPNHSRQASTISPHHDIHMPDYVPQEFDQDVIHETVHL